MVAIIIRQIPKQIEESRTLPDLLTDQARFMNKPTWETPKSYVFNNPVSEGYTIGRAGYITRNPLGEVYVSSVKNYKPASSGAGFAETGVYIPDIQGTHARERTSAKNIGAPATQINNFNDIYVSSLPEGEGFVRASVQELDAPAWLNFPAIYSADNEVQKYIDDAAKAVKHEDRLGLRSQPSGKITVYPKENDAALGVTGIRLGPRGAYADSLEINQEILNGAITHPEIYLDELYRVTKHELRHVDSAELAGYADVPEYIARMIMEGYAEYRGMVNSSSVEEALGILKTSPYKPEILAAAEIDHGYIGLDGTSTGYRAFINDIVEQRSMKAGLVQFARSVKFHAN
ncbi:MAG: hypothetical protein HY364_03940 [Candidatus Aenigmarchaeota archaeon]|nr:hypothetical protein [Candidatus Aenigmarchaeota archaeon]